MTGLCAAFGVPNRQASKRTGGRLSTSHYQCLHQRDDDDDDEEEEEEEEEDEEDEDASLVQPQ